RYHLPVRRRILTFFELFPEGPRLVGGFGETVEVVEFAVDIEGHTGLDGTRVIFITGNDASRDRLNDPGLFVAEEEVLLSFVVLRRHRRPVGGVDPALRGVPL